MIERDDEGNDDSDDSNRGLSDEERRSRRGTGSLPDEYYDEKHSLLDAAVYHLLLRLDYQREGGGVGVAASSTASPTDLELQTRV